MKFFTGKSGKFYHKNPFHDGKYSYAVYPSKDLYGKMLPVYVNNETAFLDFEEGSEIYQFTITVNGDVIEKFETSLVGELITPIDGITSGTEYLKKLKEQHGFSLKYTYEKCTTTSL